MSRALDIPGLDVSRETLDRLERFAALTIKWTAHINLIAPASAPEIWDRHIRDSAQLVLLATSDARSWVDLGSGGGFPAIVVAAILAESSPEAGVTMVESDQRKATFLRTAIRELGLTNARVESQRAEALAPQGADILSARAFAPLPALLSHAHRHLAKDGVAILPKGRNAEAEVAAARRDWRFALAIHPSLTDHEARLLRIEGIERA